MVETELTNYGYLSVNASSILSPIVMKMRNYGENIRLEEDMNLMKLRSEALKNNHKDKPKCIDEKTLLDEWFKRKILKKKLFDHS